MLKRQSTTNTNVSIELRPEINNKDRYELYITGLRESECPNYGRIEYEHQGYGLYAGTIKHWGYSWLSFFSYTNGGAKGGYQFDCKVKGMDKPLKVRGGWSSRVSVFNHMLNAQYITVVFDNVMYNVEKSFVDRILGEYFPGYRVVQRRTCASEVYYEIKEIEPIHSPL